MGYLEDLNNVINKGIVTPIQQPKVGSVTSPYQAPTPTGQPIPQKSSGNYIDNLNNLIKSTPSKIASLGSTVPSPSPVKPYMAPTPNGQPITPPLSSILNFNDPRYNNVKELIQLPSRLAGQIIQPAYNMASSATELATGNPLPRFKSGSLFPETGGGDFINSSSYQQKYNDAIASGVPEKDAYQQTLTGGIVDAIMLAEPIKGGFKAGLKTLAPETLVKPSVTSISKETLADYFSGRKTAGELGITPEMKATITDQMKGMDTVQKAKFLQGFDLLNSKPSLVGKMLGITEEEAKAMLKSYGGQVRETPAGALPGYKMNYQAGGINIKGEPVGFSKEPIPGETPAQALARSEAYAKQVHPSVSLKSDINTGKPIRLTAQEQALVGTGKKAVPFMTNKSSTPSTLPPLPQKGQYEPPATQLESRLSPSTQDTTNKVNYQVTGDTPKEKIQSAITNSERIKNEITSTGQDAYSAGNKLSPSDIKLAEGYETGTTSVPDLVKQAENPQQMQKFMDKLINYYDFRLAADRGAGGTTAQVSNYVPHQWDLSKPKDLERFNNLAMQKGLQPYKGFRSQPRVFDTYAQGEAMGFKRANPNIVEDLKHDYGSAADTISKQVLKKGLKEGVPGMITTKGFGRTPTGKPYVNSNIKGLEGMSYDPLVHKQLAGYQPRNDTNLFNVIKENGAKTPKEIWSAVKDIGVLDTAASLYDVANKNLKTMILNFSGFHSINISLSYGGHALFADPLRGITGIAKSLRAMVDEGYTQKLIEGYKKDMIPGTKMSVFDAGLRSGVNMGRALNPTGGAKYNPLTQSSHLIFDRELHILKMETVKMVFGDGKINPESTKGHDLGKEINMLMGEMNTHTQNIDPNIQKWMSRTLLAPSFTESKFKIVGDAALKWDKEKGAGGFARKAVIGKSIIVALIATFGTLLATGKFPSLQQIALNSTIDPGTQTNLTNPKGKKLDIKYPKTFVSEASGFFTDPKQYAMNRLSPALSTGLKVFTGTDQLGNPLVDPNVKESKAMQITKNLGTGFLPIGAQAVISAAQGKTSKTQAGISIAGLSTKINPNDPSVLKYKGIDDAKKAIDNIGPADPQRTQKIQEIYNGLDTAQKKNLNYQLLLSGVSTKGVLSSDAGKMKPLYDQLQVMKQAGQTEQANAIWARLSADDKKLYAKVKTYYKKSDTSQSEKDFQPTFQSIRDMKTSGDPALEAQADTQYNELNASDKHIYQLLKAKE